MASIEALDHNLLLNDNGPHYLATLTTLPARWNEDNIHRHLANIFLLKNWAQKL